MQAQRYATLDAMRGIAALAVAVYHFAPGLAPSGYLAVDFFFALSGFVLAQAYGERFARGLTWQAFMAARLVRLYPLALLGVVLGSMFVLQGIARGSDLHMPAADLAVSLPLNLLLLPSPATPELFPLNVPAWSLMFEVLANLAMALGLIRANRALPWLVGGSAAVLVMTCRTSIDVGGHWATLLPGTARTLFSFGAGMLIARIAQAPRRAAAGPALLLAGALGVLLCLAPGPARLGYDLAVTFAVWPALVWLGSRCEPGPALRGGAILLGEISFALYATHEALIPAVHFAERRLGLDPAIGTALFVAAATLSAWAAARWFDAPVRAWLRGALLTPARAG